MNRFVKATNDALKARRPSHVVGATSTAFAAFYIAIFGIQMPAVGSYAHFALMAGVAGLGILAVVQNRRLWQERERQIREAEEARVASQRALRAAKASCNAQQPTNRLKPRK